MTPYFALITGNHLVRVYDKVLVSQDIRKFSEYQAAQHGFNYWDGENKHGAVTVTKYLAEAMDAGIIYNGKELKPGDVMLLEPSEIKRLVSNTKLPAKRNFKP